MTFFNKGNIAGRGIPATKCYRATFGVSLANGQHTPCTAQGQKAEFVFNDTVDGVDTVEDGFGVGLLSPTHSGGLGVPVLAGGPITAGHQIVVGLATFTNDAGTVVTLPVAFDVDDAADGDWIVGIATMGTDAAAKDTDINSPSIALFMYSIPVQARGGEDVSSFDTFTFDIDLALLANGDVITDWTPGFAGEFVSHAFRVKDPVTTAAKAATLNLEIGAVNVTGGVLALTSANCTPTGAVINGTAITAANAFAADDTVSWEASAVTTFVEGSGTLIIVVRHTAA